LRRFTPYFAHVSSLDRRSRRLRPQSDKGDHQDAARTAYRPTPREDEDALTRAIIDLASQYGRLRVSPDHGAASGRRLACEQGPRGAHLALRRAEDAAAPEACGWLWLKDGSCDRLWSSVKVIEALADVMVMKSVPEHLRSDNGPEFVARDLRQWLHNIGAKTLYIEPGSPWESGYCESFNSKLSDEFLNCEIFYSM
jgi:putative transposase